MSTTVATTIRSPACPVEAIAGSLQGELVMSIRAQAARTGVILPDDDSSLVTNAIPIDSLLVVESLCVLDEILPFQVGESIVRPGGYDTVQAAIAHVMVGVEKEWIKHHGFEP